jgi:iron-sulfur cluster repair protein YtfE (RIC family)
MIGITIGGPKGKAATLDQPLEHLMACHRRIEERLDTLERAGRFLWERREEALEAIRNAFAFLDRNGVMHTEDEEQSVFPRLQGKLGAEQAALVQDLESDHQLAEATYAELKTIVEQVTAAPERNEELRSEYTSVVADLCGLYRRHIAREDTELIEIGSTVLTAAELAEIAVEMKRRRGLVNSDSL